MGGRFGVGRPLLSFFLFVGWNCNAMARKPDELVGEFDFERNIFGQGDGRKIVGVLADGKVVTGYANEGTLESGLTYRFWGWWVKHPRYGDQFNFHYFEVCRPVGEVGTIKYLQRVKGIGRRRAALIWDKFGPECLQVLKEDPEQVADKIPGLTIEAAKLGAEYFKRIEYLEQTTIELIELLGSRGFPQRLIPMLIDEHGSEAAAVVRRNPWILMNYRGCGFFKTDSLALVLGRSPEAIDRQGWCIYHALHSDREGHIWYPESFAAETLGKNLAGVDVDMAKAVEWACRENLIVSRTTDRRTWLAETAKAMAEAEIARFVHQAEMETLSDPPRWPNVEECEGIDEDQKEELRKATRGYLGILGGRPGVGKTRCMASLIKAILKSGQGRILASAPTGKAAVRATEALNKQQVSIRVKTIHSTLRVESSEDGTWRFAHDESNPLPCDFLFCDEGSMVDTLIGASWLSARPRGCHVLIVGDPDQLSPVGPGAVLRDLIAAGVPTGHLTKIRRNAGRIEKVCKSIAETGEFEPSPQLDLEAGENFVWIEKSRPEQQIEALKGFLDRIRSGGKYDVLQDVQILTPLNKQSPVSRVPLNKILQGHLNPAGERAEGNPFRKGDKVICTQNGWPTLDDEFREWLRKECQVIGDDLRTRVYRTPSGDLEVDKKNNKVYVANGELGLVTKIAPKLTTISLSCPDRVIKVPRGSQKDDDGDEGGDNDETSTGCNWELGYVISIHKSQGSEWPIVVTMADSSGSAMRLADKHLIYTALSRGKVFEVGIGQKRAILEACKISRMWDRRTFLRELIEELREKDLDRLWDADLAEAFQQTGDSL
jgi:exodeoxyribonuclease V alpha subunit